MGLTESNASQKIDREKRLHIRVPSSRPVVLLLNDQSIYATMTDFSKHGIGFMASAAPDTNTRIEVHFDIQDQDREATIYPFQFKAVVKHCLAYNELNHIGVKLDLPTQKYMNLFDKIASS